MQIRPNEAKNLELAFDPSSDPDFGGRLSVQVAAYLSDGRIAFRTQVNLEVHTEDEDGQH